MTSEEVEEFAAQLVGLLEAAIGIEVLLPEAIDRAGHMARDRVDRLVLPREALGIPGIDERHGRILAKSIDEVDVDDIAEVRTGCEVPGPWRGRFGGHP